MLSAHFFRALACALSTRLDDIYAFYDTGERAAGGDGMDSGRATLFHGS